MMTRNAQPACMGIRTKLLISSASAAIIAVAAAPQQAHAQTAPGAFQGTPGGGQGNIATIGTATRSAGTGTETITVQTGKTQIDWAPFDQQTGTTAPIDFLPATNTATFTSASGLTDYTVLNRIVPVDPNRPIALNGTILSTLQGGSTTGGRIWFYSPGGILVGSSAVIDVGSLLLTTADPTSWSTTAGGFTGSFGTGQAATNPTSKIVIDAGAQLKALQQNSYIAMVAPRIEQAGSVRVNGSAAYVAAEQLTMTMNQGLFDIQVPVGGGTADGNGIDHSGTTGGPANVAASDNHSIYMVAVPKNQALTMLLGGDIGFDAAATGATVENGQIVLSAGSSIDDSTAEHLASTEAGADASLLIGTETPAHFSSNVFGIAHGDITALATLGDLDFDRNLTLFNISSPGTGGIMIEADSGYTASVGGDLLLYSTNSAGAAPTVEVDASGGNVIIGGNAQLEAGSSASGNIGTAFMSAFNGTLSIGGTATLYANAPAASVDPQTASANSHGGSIEVYAYNGGTIETGGMVLDASANGQDNAGGGDTTAGDGTGGQIFIETGGGTINVNGSLYANASGYGGNMLDGSTAAGAGYGGAVYLEQFGGSIEVTGDTTLTAHGIGGSYLGGSTPTLAAGGFGQGGTANVWSGGAGTIKLDGNITVAANGTGGSGQTGGDGIGGSAGIAGNNGTIVLGPSISISATGVGGDANVGFGGLGGRGEGRVAYIEALTQQGNIEVPSSQAVITGGVAHLDVSGAGGIGGAGDGASIAAGAGGDGQGGYYQGETGSGGAFAAADETGGSLTLGETTLISNGQGGAGGTGGAGQVGGAGGSGSGGTAQAGNYDLNGTGGTTASAAYGSLALYSNGYGGAGGSGATGQGDGGSGYGGTSYLGANALVHVLGNTYLTAQGFGGGGANGGLGQGGFAVFEAVGTASMQLDGSATVDSSGTGGNASNGVGGAGNGGITDEAGNSTGIFARDNSSITVGADLNALSFGTGGLGTTGGTGTGGDAAILAGGSISAHSLTADTNATGGNGTAGGAAQGGNASLVATGNISVTDLTVRASAHAGQGGAAAGGNATAGNATLTIDGGNLAMTGQFNALANAVGGGGGGGGVGTGGTTLLTVLNGGIANLGTTGFATANGFGGASAGGTGASGTGGTTTIDIQAGSQLTASGFHAQAAGTGGNGVDGGSGTSGNISVTVSGAGAQLGLTNSEMFAQAAGGSGSNNGGSATSGSVSLTIGAGATADFTGDFLVVSDAFGGSGGSGSGGDATGGTASLTADGAISGNARLIVEAAGVGGAGGSVGGNGSGGLASADVTGGVSVGGLTVDAGAVGGASTSAAGGQASAGEARLNISNGGTLTGAANVNAAGIGGNGATGGAGLGGSATLWVAGALTAPQVNIDGRGTGGNGSVGDGGYSRGGTSEMVIDGGSADVSGNLWISAVGNADLDGDGILDGGFGAINGGDSDGGLASVTITPTGGSLTVTGETDILARATGGNAGTGNGGNATGGDAEFIVGGSPPSCVECIYTPQSAPSVTLGGLLQLVSVGLGGNGGNSAVGGTGGNGFGGSTNLAVNIGSFVSSGDVMATSRGLGGNGGAGASGNGGNGGNGTGGVGDFTLASDFTANSYQGNARGFGGIGGAGATGAGDGGNAVGGQLYVDILSGATMHLADALVLTSSTFGGNGANGGDASDGIAEIDIAGALTATGLLEAAAQAFAGNGSAGTGGSSHAGTATISVTGSASVGTVYVAAQAGGDATQPYGVGTNGGGNAVGGSASFNVDGGTVTVTGEADIIANALGGPGGAGQAGTATAGAVTASSVNGGSLIADTLYQGSTGDSGTGSVALTANGGTMTLGNLTLETSNNLVVPALGTDITVSGLLDLISSLDISFGNLDVGRLKWKADGDVNGGDIVVAGFVNGEAQGAVTIGKVTAGGADSDGFSVALSSATSIRTGNVSGTAGVGFATYGDLTTGNIIAGDLVMALVGGNISMGSITTANDGRVYLADSSMFVDNGGLTDNFDANTVLGLDPVATGGAIALNGPVSTGAFQAAAGTSLSTGAMAASGNVTASAAGALSLGDIGAGQSIALNSGGALTTGALTAGQSIAVDSGAALTTGDLGAGTSIHGTSVGNLTVGAGHAGTDLTLASGAALNAGNLTADGALSLTAVTNLVAGSLSAGGDLSLSAAGDATALDLTGAQAVTVHADRDVSVANVASGGGKDVTVSAGRNATTGSVNSAGKIALTASGNVASADLTAASTATVAAGGNSSVHNVSATEATFTDGGTATFLGSVSAPKITVTSSDINVANGASLGVYGVTDLLTLNAVSDQPIVIGDSGAAPPTGAYVLNEAGDVHAANIVVNAVAAGPSGTAPDIHIYDVTVEGSGTSGGGTSSVVVNTPGSILVAGAIDYADAGATDSLSLNSGAKIEVVTDRGGGIAMTDGGGNLAGTLELTGHDVWVADQATLAKLESNVNYAARNSDLATNLGANNPAGNLQAGGITVDLLGSSLLVQNSGTALQPAGLSVGDGGLTINNHGADPATVIVYGRKLSGGTTSAGRDFVPLIVTSGTFSQDSTINDCPVDGCPPPQSPIGAESILGPVGLMGGTAVIVTQDPADNFVDLLADGYPEGNENEEGGSDDSSAPPDFWQGPINTGPISFGQPIEEPVTSGGDAVLTDGPPSGK